MSVILCKEIGEGRSGSWQQEGRRFVFTAERTWQVVTDNLETSWLEILIAGSRINITDGLPLIGDVYDTDTEAAYWIRCTGFSPNQDGDDPFVWTVTVHYSSDSQQELVGSSQGSNTGGASTAASGGKLVADPLKLPVRVNYSVRQRKVQRERDFSKKPAGGWAAVLLGLNEGGPVNFDHTGRAFVNSAGERFPGGIEDEEYNLVITVRRNVRKFDRTQAWTYIGCVNENRWANYAERAARITNWTGDPEEEHAVFYYAETLEIEVQWPNWDWNLLNEGTYGWARDQTTGHYTGVKEVVDSNSGLAVNGLVLLDAKGGILPRTYIDAAFAAGQQVVTPKSMRNIFVGEDLLVGTDDEEEQVRVTAVTATTFTATFANAHAARCLVTGVPTYKNFRRRTADFKAFKLAI